MVVEFEVPEALDAWLRQSVLAVGVEPFVLSMTSHGYARSTIRVYVGAVAHLARWMTQEQLALKQLDERLVDRFVNEHISLRRRPGFIGIGLRLWAKSCKLFSSTQTTGSPLRNGSAYKSSR